MKAVKKINIKKVRKSGGCLVIPLTEEFKLIGAEESNDVKVIITMKNKIVIEKVKEQQFKKR